jgi:ATP-dependent DNA helicase RecG
MRVGEDLLPMTDEKILEILSEQEPDFSAKICPDLSLSDLVLPSWCRATPTGRNSP